MSDNRKQVKPDGIQYEDEFFDDLLCEALIDLTFFLDECVKMHRLRLRKESREFLIKDKIELIELFTRKTWKEIKDEKNL